MKRALLACALLLASAPGLAEVLPLDELLARAAEGLALGASAAEQDALAALRQQREAEAGWQWFAAASTGRYRELVTEDVRDDYYGRNLALGLRHPLLGSLYRQRDAVQAIVHDQQRQTIRQLLQRAERRLALRSAYADWWRADQEQRWCAELLPAAQQARERLALRQREGWLRQSQARQLDGQWQALQRRCAQREALLEETRDGLAELAGLELSAAQQPRAESLAGQVQPLSAWRQAIERHPRLQARQDEVRQADQRRESPWYAGVDSHFSLAQSYEDRSGAPKPGDGLVASLTFSAPFDPLGYGRARTRETEARHQTALAQVQSERGQLLQALGQALRLQRQSIEELRAEREQLEVSHQALDELRLREQRAVETTADELLAADVEYQRSGLRLIGARHAAWLREAELRLFAEDDSELARLLGDQSLTWQALSGTAGAAAVTLAANRRAAAGPSRDWQQGVYVWDSVRLLDARSRTAELRELRRAGMQRLYLGLSAAQLADLPSLRQRLQATLAAARNEGLQVALLLGDPAWLQPEHRQGLLTLLGQLRGLPFAALHLDLEVEQLGWPVPDSRLQDWLDTLAAVTSINPWPLELSSHHRWFVEPVAGQTCVPCALPQRGVRQVSLMIYTRNAESSAALAEQIARRWPALQFRLAQSVEPQLTAEESWSGVPRHQLQRQVGRWRTRLQPVGIRGIDWQDWPNYPR
ncbi:TolC family protein [Pseudomonas cavernae]|uniref:TolC family protein n=1 Tax=Pseudomonas cavernae TaxID=2320867 RepID=A0A385YWP1_9PSED|nr:TolC family protein [Pseudomonas cavernae]AYC31106.1 TolC family protein [Pseudomonas cavernae]